MKICIFITSFMASLYSHSSVKKFDYRIDSIDLLSEIRDVITYSDRAQVKRVSRIETFPKKSEGWIKFSGLPFSIDKTTIRVKVKNGKKNSINQVIVEDSYEQVSLDEDLKRNIEQLKLLFAEKLDILQQRSLQFDHYNFVRNIQFLRPFPKENYVYQDFNASISNLELALDLTHEKKIIFHQKIEKINEELKKIDKRIDYIIRMIEDKTDFNSQKWVSNIYVKLNKNIYKNEEVVLSYFVPKAWWHPIYDIRADLDLKKGRANIKLISSGLVEQHTGENWKNIGIILSTLDPTPLYLPQLNKWSFKEIRTEEIDEEESTDNISLNDRVSRYAPKKNPKHKKKLRRLKESLAFGGKKKARELRKSIEKKEGYRAQNAVLEQDLKSLHSSLAAPKDDSYGRGAGRKSMKVGRVNNSKMASPPLSTATRIFPLLALEDVFSDYSRVKSRVNKLYSSKVQYKKMDHEFRIRPKKNIYRDSKLPAVSARGRVIEIKSPFKIDLKHDEEALKIPLNSKDLIGELSYLTIPKKDKRVFLRAKAKNTTGIPLLAGSAQIFMNGDLVSKTNLHTVSEGSYFNIELGVDKGIDTQRIVTKTSEENGLVFKKHSTNVEVKIEISNTHNFPIKITIRDHYPLSPNDKIGVKLKKIEPNPSYKKDGYLTWEGKIKGKEKKIYTFIYNVTHPDKFILSEYN